MSRITFTVTMDVDDKYEVDLLNKINTLRKNERISEFAGEALREALDDPVKTEKYNKLIRLNGHGEIEDRRKFFDNVLQRLSILEELLNNIRYETHTAAVLADQARFQEISVDIMTILDSSFTNIKNMVQTYQGDYADAIRWSQREKALLEKFNQSLSNIRLLEKAFSIEEDTGPKTSEQTSANAELLARMEEAISGIADLKELIQSATIMDTSMIDKNLQIAGSIINAENNFSSATNNKPDTEPEPVTPVNTGEPVSYEAPPEEFGGDLDALAAFFGGM